MLLKNHTRSVNLTHIKNLSLNMKHFCNFLLRSPQDIKDLMMFIAGGDIWGCKLLY